MIKRFSVSNFKSIKSVNVDFSDVTVLVGRSGTGKSNFLRAIQFFRNLIIADGCRNRIGSNLPATLEKSEQNTPMRFEIEFAISGMNSNYVYSIELNDTGTKQEKLSLGDDILFHRIGRTQDGRSYVPAKWSVEPKVVNLPNVNDNSLAIRQLSELQEVVIAYSALSSGISFYDFPDTVLTPKSKPASVSGLSENAENYVEVLRDMSMDLRDFTVRKRMVEALKRVNSTVTSVELDNIISPQFVTVGHEFDGKVLSLPLVKQSVGFRRFYAHLLALYQKPAKLCMMFEHPEDGIHPGAMQLLAEEFKAAAQEDRGQIVFTTHNPRLLDQFDADSIRVVDINGFNTRIGPVSAEQREAIDDALLDTGELLTSDPARLDEASGNR